jgi:tetratricopeptide (TPR) repeat protein
MTRAQTLVASSELEAAIGETSRVIDDAVALFGPNAPTVGTGLLGLARLQLRAGQAGPAMASADRAKEILAASIDPNGAGYASLLEVRGSALMAGGRVREALRDLNAAEQLFRAAFGAANASVARVRELRSAAGSSGAR